MPNIPVNAAAAAVFHVIAIAQTVLPIKGQFFVVVSLR
jgi:hypothetical protein